MELQNLIIMKAKTKKKSVSLPKLKAKLQILVNAYVRQRDKDLPCISCGEFKSDMQAGHFYAVKGYDGLRYDLDNIHGECSGCNIYNESHLINYADNLFDKLGEVRYMALKQRAAEYKMNGYKWSRSELEEMIAKFKQMLSEQE